MLRRVAPQHKLAPKTVRISDMSSVTSTYGANIAFIEELYEKFRTDPDSVSPSWREFFRDFQEPDGAPALSPAGPPAAGPALHPVPAPTDINAIPLRGAAGKIA